MSGVAPQLMESLRWAVPPQAPPPAWAYPVAVLGVAAVLGLAVWLLRRRRKEQEPVGPPPEPPHHVALAALAALHARLAEGEGREFVVRVSDVVRTCIQNAGGKRARILSTEELLWQAQEDRAFPPEQQELLAGFLRQCDLVKFARRQADEARREELLASAVRFVEEAAARHKAEGTAR